MTTLYQEKKRCAICGNNTDFTAIRSTNVFGSPDLDTRPPQMQRSTIFAWVQRCPECGYCASDLSKANPGSEAVVSGAEYRRQLNDYGYPFLANSFLCKAIVDREAREYVGATWALIRAAWVCDDAERPDEAVMCRHKAANMLVTAEELGRQVADQDGVSTAILVDLLRRSGRTDDAAIAIAERRSRIAEDIILRILDFQAVLIRKGDVRCHTISEGFEQDAGD